MRSPVAVSCYFSASYALPRSSSGRPEPLRAATGLYGALPLPGAGVLWGVGWLLCASAVRAGCSEVPRRLPSHQCAA